MIVSSFINGIIKTVLRAEFTSEYRKNGSFVDIWFERDGKKQRVSVPIADFQEFLNSSDQGRQFGLGYDVDDSDPIFKRWEEAENKKVWR